MADGAVGALQLIGVTKRAPSGATILHGIDLEVAPGAMVALMGGNGAGKSTLLDLVCGLTAPNEGRVSVFGRPVRAAVRAGLLGGMMQSGGLLPELTVLETVELIAALHRRPVPALEDLDPGLARLDDRRISACSGGEQQRVKWALAAIPKPRLLVLDEPTAGMDWQARHAFWARVARHRDEGAAVVYATHYADEVEGIADCVAHLESGRLVTVTTPARIRQAGTGEPGGAGFFSGLTALAAGWEGGHS